MSSTHGRALEPLLPPMRLMAGGRASPERRRHHAANALRVGAAVGATLHRTCRNQNNPTSFIRGPIRYPLDRAHKRGDTMRGLILAIVASSAIVAFAPSSQASPLIPAGGITAALDDGATQVYWRRYHQSLLASPLVLTRRITKNRNAQARRKAGRLLCDQAEPQPLVGAGFFSARRERRRTCRRRRRRRPSRATPDGCGPCSPGGPRNCGSRSRRNARPA